MGVRGPRHGPAASPLTSAPLRERPGTHCIEGWVSSRAGLEGCGIRSPGLSTRNGWLYRNLSL
jgi:hypothetical protein